MRSSLLSCLAPLVSASACASGGSTNTEAPNATATSDTKTKRRSSGNVITAREIAAAEVSSAYEAVERLRPEFFRTRGAASTQDINPPDIIVYMDNVRLGTIEALRRIEARQVEEIRYMSARDATTRYGTGHTGGVIEVTSKRSERE